jgi:hypothetical protein
VLTLPSAITVDASASNGAIVTFHATAADLVSGNVAVACLPPSGTLFGNGTTAVRCSATDAAGNTSSGDFNVTVNATADLVAPVLSLPANLLVEATSPAGATVTWVATALDAKDGPVTVSCTPPSGSTFAPGTRSVVCTAADVAGNKATGSFTVTVRDTTAPAILNITATPSVLGPPNHKLIPVVVNVSASDAGDAAPVARIVAVKSNEAVNGTGDGDTAPDWVITGPLTLQLRAERDGKGKGRIYTITVEVADRSGNKRTADVHVTVLK